MRNFVSNFRSFNEYLKMCIRTKKTRQIQMASNIICEWHQIDYFSPNNNNSPVGSVSSALTCISVPETNILLRSGIRVQLKKNKSYTYIDCETILINIWLKKQITLYIYNKLLWKVLHIYIQYKCKYIMQYE